MIHRAFISTLFAAAVIAAPAAAETPQTMLIVDASGSMWGQIDGTPKIAIARDAVADMLSAWDSSRDIGLIAYGHREQGNCNDIETLIAPAPLDRAHFAATLDSLNPTGRTPLTDAVRQAAQAMAYEDRPASVILVSDGLETCNADPCAVAATLERTGTDFTAHVIGFGLGEGEGAELACLAEETGGLFVEAANAAELNDAFVTVAAASTAPAPAAEATIIAVDDFEGDALGERWRIIEPDETAYIVDGSQLLTISTKPTTLGEDDQTNVFVWEGEPLPSGDWDLSVTFTSEFSEDGSIIEVGIYEDPENFVSARFYGGATGSLLVGVKSVVRGNATREAEDFASGRCCPVRFDLEGVEANIKENGATLTLSKRGREYSAILDTHGWRANEEAVNPFVVGPLTVLRATGQPAIFSGTYRGSRDPVVQTATEFDRFTISAP